MNTLEAKMEAQHGLPIATEDGVEIANIGKGIVASSLIEATKDVAQQDWTAQQGLDDLVGRGVLLKEP